MKKSRNSQHKNLGAEKKSDSIYTQIPDAPSQGSTDGQRKINFGGLWRSAPAYEPIPSPEKPRRHPK